MSNTRKARGSGRVLKERCTFCKGALGRGAALRLRTGQVACARCRETGYLQKLSCGHFTLPGALVINENGDGKTYVCADCASGAREFGNARFGLGKKA
jgi:hypothetical protein